MFPCFRVGDASAVAVAATHLIVRWARVFGRPWGALAPGRIGFGWPPVRSSMRPGRFVPTDEIATAIARCAGCHPDGVATVGSIDSGEREPSITGAIRYGAAARSSSTVEHQLRCRSRRSSPSIWRQIMRTAVLQETPVPGRTSRRRRTVHVSHSRYAGLHRQSPSSSQPPGEMHVLPFCSSH